MCTTFDRDCLVDNITLNTCGRCQADLQTTHTANNAAIHHNIIGDNFTFDGGTFPNGQQMGADIALDLAFDIDVARGFDIAGDQQIG
mgnify:CR=1 FL=1